MTQNKIINIHSKLLTFIIKPILLLSQQQFYYLKINPSCLSLQMGKKKMVENYQLLEVIGQIEDMYEIIKAKHVEQKKYYTLKKVKIKNDKNNRLFQGFLNEASLLKQIKHPNFVKSIKMMKTATSIYVVYDFCDGLNLMEWMEKGSKKTIAEKQAIVKQLCLVLAEMKKVGIAHLYLNPESIFISEAGDVKVTDFMYGTDMPEDIEEQIELQNKVPKTDFTAPQVKKGLACFQSDLYSFGKIVQFMEMQNSKKGTLSTKQFNVKCEQYQQVIKKSIKKKPYERQSLDDIYKLIFKTKGKLRKMKSMSMSLSKIGGKESMLSRSSQITTASGREKGQANQDLILKILKRRNMSRLLVQLFKNIVDANYINSQTHLILVTLLLKKSTIIMNSIGKFMKYGKGIPQLQLNERERNKFFKSGDYFKMQPLVDNEVKLQKKQFQLALQSIYLDNVKILQNKLFNMQLKKQQLDENYLRELMKEFITNSVQQMDLQTEHTNFPKAIYIMGMILDHGSFELFFQKKINTYPIDLIEQPTFIKINNQMSIKDLIIELQKYKKSQQQPVS